MISDPRVPDHGLPCTPTYASAEVAVGNLGFGADLAPFSRYAAEDLQAVGMYRYVTPVRLIVISDDPPP